MKRFAVVAIDCSAGCVEALLKLCSELDPGMPAAIFIVLHVGRRRSWLPEILSRVTTFPVAFGATGDIVRPGRTLVAPPDYHLLLEYDRVSLSRGPAETWARPAVDPQFRTAATAACGNRAIGVILFGMLSDGTAGLIAVRGAGRISLVQDPMPTIQWCRKAL